MESSTPEGKPVSITLLLKKLKNHSYLTDAPNASEMNRALRDAGLITRAKTDGGGSGWAPTAAGKEVGIIAATDKRGNPFCLYTPSAEAVVASLAEQIVGGTS